MSMLDNAGLQVIFSWYQIYDKVEIPAQKSPASVDKRSKRLSVCNLFSRFFQANP
jgi:hypothetical protein